ncbi:MAG: DUF4177 domain-containing protein [Anaerolineae bacterium]|jgi:siroheme synthase (precorrin-2 oxidase/ferrochelatase)|nr:DUF4177 domain-containing protein [Chloroflexota bacterium]
MERWEYKVVSIIGGGEATNRRLNEYGQEGWELVSVSTSWFYFKRPLAG